MPKGLDRGLPTWKTICMQICYNVVYTSINEFIINVTPHVSWSTSVQFVVSHVSYGYSSQFRNLYAFGFWLIFHMCLQQFMLLKTDMNVVHFCWNTPQNNTHWQCILKVGNCAALYTRLKMHKRCPLFIKIHGHAHIPKHIFLFTMFLLSNIPVWTVWHGLYCHFLNSALWTY